MNKVIATPLHQPSERFALRRSSMMHKVQVLDGI